MRGQDTKERELFSYISLESRVPADHPLRAIRQLADEVLREMSPQFGKLYSDTGRPSIPPERLLRALLLQVFYSVRSERLLMEQMDYNLLFRWFVGLSPDEAVWDHAVFSKNRDRLLNESVARSFFQRVRLLAYPHMSDEHFTVDGTLIEAWASQKSFRRKDSDPDAGSGNGPREANFHGEKRRNETHQSTTDPDARLYKKSKGSESKLSYLGHALMENRNGLLFDTLATLAGGKAERDAALRMLKKIPGKKRITAGGDKNYDTQAFVGELRELNITPHVAQKKHSAIDARTTCQPGYQISQQKRKRVEQIFGWMKTVGLLRKVKVRGLPKVRWWLTFMAAAYNLYRLPKLQAANP
jgi:transposase